MMISHFNIGVNDLEAATAFYDALLETFDPKVLFKTDRSVFYALGDSNTKLCINKPFNGEAATAGNGAMIAFTGSSKEQVEQLHAKALALGGSDEGAPGDRMDGVIYAAYFRDPEGNKFGIFYSDTPVL